ncbi:hypothetical protein [Neorhodopirellula pilleata]|uniref:Uncharacterized protein n=1 Tax=Neorhodopirellula pilleata TaxID=2714738 RepID=A0A5C5ZVP6_9BACT|nr:hypothetical protein [Neorhodopirellula pilleata]TWT91389.1 hypothetical protein Pla100_52390 [Neorhodopirellula pilleata]TWT91438.1 hypothetical protein Pla100_52880 [Neorhodopirellula pilleata]
MTSDETIADVSTADELEQIAATPTAAASQTPVDPPVIVETDLVDDSISIEITERFGFRNVRGKPRRVPTGHLNVIVDGKMHAWTMAAGGPIFALAEFLPDEIPQVVEAVRKFTGEESPREFYSNDTPSQAEIDKLTNKR